MATMKHYQTLAKIFFPLRVIYKLLNYAKQSFKCAVQEPKLFLMRKLSRIEAIRNTVHHLNRLFFNPDCLVIEESSIVSAEISTVVLSIEKEGYYAGLQLPAKLQEGILKYVNETPCAGDRDLDQQFYIHNKAQIEAQLNKKFNSAAYDAEACPEVQKMIHSSELLTIAARFLCSEPAYVGSDLLWSFPVDATVQEKIKMAQVFHYDLDDYRSIKFFFYLTDVDETSGAHVLIRNSHQNKKFLHQLYGQRCASIPDEQLVQVYGAENVKAICGAAGFGFVEDPCCFHKGTLPIHKERLMLQIEYATRSYRHLRKIC